MNFLCTYPWGVLSSFNSLLYASTLPCLPSFYFHGVPKNILMFRDALHLVSVCEVSDAETRYHVKWFDSHHVDITWLCWSLHSIHCCITVHNSNIENRNMNSCYDGSHCRLSECLRQPAIAINFLLFLPVTVVNSLLRSWTRKNLGKQSNIGLSLHSLFKFKYIYLSEKTFVTWHPILALYFDL